MLYSIGTAEARVRGVLHFSKVFFSFFTFVKKVIFSLACVCLSVTGHDNSRMPGWIVFILGMWVDHGDTSE